MAVITMTPALQILGSTIEMTERVSMLLRLTPIFEDLANLGPQAGRRQGIDSVWL